MKHSAAGTAGLGGTADLGGTAAQLRMRHRRFWSPFRFRITLRKKAAQLRKRHRSLWDPKVDYAEQEHSDLALRTNRAISWLKRATSEHRPSKASRGDPDAAFIFLWMAFNAAYATETEQKKSGGELKLIGDYFKKLLKLDDDNAIYDAIWNKCSAPARLLLDNEYLFRRYWKNVAEKPGGENWEDGFSRDKEKAALAFKENNVNDVLELLFDRLYGLRNQLFHGGAKWGSSLNRDAVRAGVNILNHLVPICVDLMLKEPRDTDWGKLEYPPRDRQKSVLGEESRNGAETGKQGDRTAGGDRVTGAG